MLEVVFLATQTPGTIDEYISQFSEDIQQKLQAVRAAIRAASPEAQEKISWQMPTFYLFGNLIHFAANARHIGIYPGASGIEKFTAEFIEQGYKFSKGAVQFPYNRDLPLDLIRRMTAFRVAENLADQAGR